MGDVSENSVGSRSIGCILSCSVESEVQVFFSEVEGIFQKQLNFHDLNIIIGNNFIQIK